MALLLNIDTSTDQASICVAENAQSLCLLSNSTQTDHAAWMQIAIKQAFEIAGKSLNSLDAVAIMAGPGSYTGLRVSMASAKGLCYALNLPLIAINTLEAMAFSVSGTDIDIDYICPMIDARRMEVFTALYDKNLKNVVPPCAMILETHHFNEYLQQGRVLFFGNGSEKWKKIQYHPNALFSTLGFNAEDLAKLSHQRFLSSNFAQLAYIEPIYIKDFYIPGIKG